VKIGIVGSRFHFRHFSNQPQAAFDSKTMPYGDRAAFDRLVRLERTIDVAKGSAAMIAYHDAAPAPHAHNVLAPWVRAASNVASKLLGVLPTVLVTSSQDSHYLTTPPFSRVLRADLLALSGLGPAVPARALCGLKITALLHGWAVGALPERVLVLDHDIIIIRPRSLLRMLDPLSHYDFAGVMEGLSRGWDGSDPNVRNDSLASAPDPAGRGWEVNSGVLAIRRQAAWVVKLWQAEFASGVRLYQRLTGVDQSALMWVLAHEPRARLFAMPPIYNFRAPALYSNDLGAPVAFHSRTALRSPSPAAAAHAMNRVAHSVAESASQKIGALSRRSEHSPASSAASRSHTRHSSRAMASSATIRTGSRHQSSHLSRRSG
jgi:hypothetical protein